MHKLWSNNPSELQILIPAKRCNDKYISPQAIKYCIISKAKCGNIIPFHLIYNLNSAQFHPSNLAPHIKHFSYNTIPLWPLQSWATDQGFKKRWTGEMETDFQGWNNGLIQLVTISKERHLRGIKNEYEVNSPGSAAWPAMQLSNSQLWQNCSPKQAS